jgi:histone acetyltransferase
MDTKLEADEYETIDQFIFDVKLVFDNCRFYNQQHTPYYKCANMLEAYFDSRLQSRGLR